MTSHVRDRLVGLPGVTENAISGLVFNWVRSKQPEILEVLGTQGVCDQVVGKRAS